MEEAKATPLGWRRRLALLLTVMLVVSVGARVMAHKKSQGSQPKTGEPTALVADQAVPGAEVEETEQTGWQKVLPFVSEGAFAMLLGLGLGIATRMIFKMVVLGMLLFFLATQFLAYKGLLTVDWATFMGWTRDFVMNISQQADFSSIVKHKLPAVGAFIMGCVLGLKRS